MIKCQNVTAVHCHLCYIITLQLLAVPSVTQSLLCYVRRSLNVAIFKIYCDVLFFYKFMSGCNNFNSVCMHFMSIVRWVLSFTQCISGWVTIQFVWYHTSTSPMYSLVPPKIQFLRQYFINFERWLDQPSISHCWSPMVLVPTPTKFFGPM